MQVVGTREESTRGLRTITQRKIHIHTYGRRLHLTVTTYTMLYPSPPHTHNTTQQTQYTRLSPPLHGPVPTSIHAISRFISPVPLPPETSNPSIRSHLPLSCIACEATSISSHGSHIGRQCTLIEILYIFSHNSFIASLGGVRAMFKKNSSFMSGVDWFMR